ncbi:MAG TPA: RNase adapter RapZ [Tenuifilaceae bacterium]|nr:RNase adapter RapZ [Tenuifilaceae bacterium]
MNQIIIDTISQLFKSFTGVNAETIVKLPQSGSDRQYFRLSAQGKSYIGAYNPDIQENRTFIYLTKHFHKAGLPVSEIFGVSPDETCYLLTDLGDETLFQKVVATNWREPDSETVKEILKESLTQLAYFQVEGAKGLDFTNCYPKSSFDLQSVMWDFNYFKYCFLKPSGIPFNEANLENDFLAFARVLLSHSCSYFLYRDFQSRNIMLVSGKPYFIDYQGGRRGPLLYDVASFLYQAKAQFPQHLRDELFEFYLSKVEELTEVESEKLRNEFPYFILFRVLQTLGAYGYRGFFERRTHFLQSIPYAAANLKGLINRIDIQIPELQKVLLQICEKYEVPGEQTEHFNGLTIEVTSFSFKKGYPEGHPEHGGGFVFDCRSLPNPGRLEEYRNMNGTQKPVAEYLKKYDEVDSYFNKVRSIVDDSVQVYLNRGFQNLAVSFGCTGGQHRSVYMASRLAKSLMGNNNLRVILNHRELNTE